MPCVAESRFARSNGDFSQVELFRAPCSEFLHFWHLTDLCVITILRWHLLAAGDGDPTVLGNFYGNLTLLLLTVLPTIPIPIDKLVYALAQRR
jgi:hypothetical protein